MVVTYLGLLELGKLRVYAASRRRLIVPSASPTAATTHR
jgi:hypothetical protein